MEICELCDICDVICYMLYVIYYPLSAYRTKWSNTIKEFRRLLPTNRLRLFGQFVGLDFKGLRQILFELGDHFCAVTVYFKW